MTKKEQFLNDWINLNLIKVFEIEVFNKKTNLKDYLIFEIEIANNKFIASHEATSLKEEKSKKIAKVEMKIDFDFSLDENLQELYNLCIEKIFLSDYFEIYEH
jgi:hypothetical protein